MSVEMIDNNGQLHLLKWDQYDTGFWEDESSFCADNCKNSNLKLSKEGTTIILI